MFLKNTIFAFCCLTSMSSIAAGTVEVGPVELDSVGVIGPSAFGHQEGNMEIKITGGTGSPSAVTCSADYVTTSSSVPNYDQMLSVLLTAHTAQKPVRIGITDEPTLTAFAGRCSLVSVTLVK